VTARTFIADPPEPGRPDRRQIAALVGIAPVDRASGQVRGRGSIAGGRTAVRDVPSMATLTAIRRNPAIEARHAQPAARGRPEKAATVARTRRPLGSLDAVIRTGPLGTSLDQRDGRSAVAGARDALFGDDRRPAFVAGDHVDLVDFDLAVEGRWRCPRGEPLPQVSLPRWRGRVRKVGHATPAICA
jgi:hypothetical protein